MFMDARNFAENRLSMDVVREWAGSIASSYLNSGELPTAGVCKVAQSEELTPPQIELLAAEVNKLIHTHKYATIKDKYFAAEFPHADAKEAVSSLQAVGAPKLACSVPEPRVKKAEADAYKLWGIQPEQMDKTASVKRELRDAGEKVALLHQKAQDRQLMAKHAAASTEHRFIKEARQMVLSSGDNSLERMHVLGSLDHFLKSAEMDFARPSLAKLAYVLGSEGMLLPHHAEKAMTYFMTKEADVKAPDELISPWIQARVVNGEHPLYITLKTFHSRVNDYNNSCQNANVVQDNVRILKQKVRAL